MADEERQFETGEEQTFVQEGDVSDQEKQSGQEELKELTDLDESRLYAAMCYVAFLVFVPLLTRREDKLVNFHIRQGLVVLVGLVLAMIAIAWSPVIGTVVFLILLIGNVIALVMALQGRRWKIPGLGHLAELIRV